MFKKPAAKQDKKVDASQVVATTAEVAADYAQATGSERAAKASLYLTLLGKIAALFKK